MSEYIIEIPDEYFASYDTKRDMYYPAELDNAMPITTFVRCRDCIYFATDELGNCCTLFDFGNVKNMENGFCAWGERETINKTGDSVTHDSGKVVSE